MADDASALTIQELSGEKRVLRLVDRALPDRPLTMGVTQRAIFTWLPGNPDASVQVLGTEEKETTIQGEWNDRFLDSDSSRPLATLNGQGIFLALDLSDTMEDFCRKGQKVMFTWDRKVRHGIITEFEPTVLNQHDVQWSATFEWSSTGDPEVPAVFNSQSSLGDTRADISGQLDDLKEVMASPEFPIQATFAGTISDNLATLATTISAVEDAATQASARLLSPVEAARRVSAIMESVIEDCDTMAANLVSVPTVAIRDTIDIAQVTLGERLQAQQFVSAAIQTIRGLSRSAAQRRAEILARLDSTRLQSYRAKGGEDLRKVALRIYGDQAQWRRIAEFNNLSSAALVDGQLVFLPEN